MGLGPTRMTAPEWPHGAWMSRRLALQFADEARCLVRSLGLYGSQLVQWAASRRGWCPANR